MSSFSSNLDDSDFQTPPSIPYNASPLLIVFTLTTLVFFFVGFFSFYFYKCCFVDLFPNWAFRLNASGSLVRISGTASPNRGLDPSRIKHFPSFPYSTVKDLRKQKDSLECAICLLEFEEDSFLRLLTVCYHVFHQECIDPWLCSHKTCPVCRTELDSPTNGAKPQELGVVDGNQNGDDRRESLMEDDDIRIDVKEDGDEERGGGEKIGTEKYEEQVRTKELFGKQNNDSSKMFIRSHTTGHSIVLKRGGDEEEEGGEHDKYTLKLPEHVKIEIIRGGHNYTKSCATFMEMACAANHGPYTNCGFVEAGTSSGGDSDKKI